MATNPWIQLIQWGSPPGVRTPVFDVRFSYFCMGLNALVFLDPADWVPELQYWLQGPAVVVTPGVSPFASNFVIVTDNKYAIVSLQGTKAWQQWAYYVVGHGVQPWLPGRGSVFEPFATLLALVSGKILAQLSQQLGIFITGHSLASATGNLLSSILQSQSFPFLQTNYLFATPVHGDLTFCNTFRGASFITNHPLDPVPLLPPDAVGNMQISPYVLGLGSQLYSAGSAVWPYQTIPSGIPPSGYRWTAAFAASFASPDWSAHNTYLYLRSILNTLDPSALAFFADFTKLLKTLGLMQPWPRV